MVRTGSDRKKIQACAHWADFFIRKGKTNNTKFIFVYKMDRTVRDPVRSILV